MNNSLTSKMSQASAVSTIREYHLRELQIALDPSNPRHIMPAVAPTDVVLDVGCGAGQTLRVACPGRISFGMDIDLASLEFGRELAPDVAFVCGTAERLPYRSEHFDLVMSRVTLLYTDIPASLVEIRRVLKPGGRVWITFDTIQRPLKLLRRSRSLRGLLWFSYVVINSVWFHITGKLFRIGNRTCESFQTTWRLKKEMLQAGYRDVEIERGEHFLVKARK